MKNGKKERKALYNWSVIVTRRGGVPYYVGNVHATTERGARTKAEKQLNTGAFCKDEVSFERRSAVTYFYGGKFKVAHVWV